MDNLEHSFIVELPDLNYFKAKNDVQDVINVTNDVSNVSNNDINHENLSDEDKIIINHENLSDEDKIIEAIRKSPNIKQSKLAEIIGKSNRTVARVIKNSPRIRRVGSNRTGNWEIVDENKQSES